MISISEDAFSSGQILSKIWLAESLERILHEKNITYSLNILILGGWYGLLNFIFRTRKNIKIKQFINIDLDLESCEVSKKINETWFWTNNSFNSINEDANNFKYSSNQFDLVINTSVEHFSSKQWFDNIPLGLMVVLQSNDMKHDDHYNNHDSLEDFIKNYPLKDILYSGVKNFSYPDKEFKRYMLIGIK